MKYKNIELDFNDESFIRCAVRTIGEKYFIYKKICDAFLNFDMDIFVENVDEYFFEVVCVNLNDYNDVEKIKIILSMYKILCSIFDSENVFVSITVDEWFKDENGKETGNCEVVNFNEFLKNISFPIKPSDEIILKLEIKLGRKPTNKEICDELRRCLDEK